MRQNLYGIGFASRAGVGIGTDVASGSAAETDIRLAVDLRLLEETADAGLAGGGGVAFSAFGQTGLTGACSYVGETWSGKRCAGSSSNAGISTGANQLELACNALAASGGRRAGLAVDNTGCAGVDCSQEEVWQADLAVGGRSGCWGDRSDQSAGLAVGV